MFRRVGTRASFIFSCSIMSKRKSREKHLAVGESVSQVSAASVNDNMQAPVQATVQAESYTEHPHHTGKVVTLLSFLRQCIQLSAKGFNPLYILGKKKATLTCMLQIINHK